MFFNCNTAASEHRRQNCTAFFEVAIFFRLKIQPYLCSKLISYYNCSLLHGNRSKLKLSLITFQPFDFSTVKYQSQDPSRRTELNKNDQLIIKFELFLFQSSIPHIVSCALVHLLKFVFLSFCLKKSSFWGEVRRLFFFFLWFRIMLGSQTCCEPGGRKKLVFGISNT